MRIDCDALVIGGGAAGAAAAIFLAQSGWRVALAEQHAYPRRKVCGECIAAGNLTLLDLLGVGAAFREAAGPELRQVGWMDATSTVRADMPACSSGPYAYGRTLGRDRLDPLLLESARALGVCVLQPAKIRSIRGAAGSFECAIRPIADLTAACDGATPIDSVHAHVVIDAHGSWERAPDIPGDEAAPGARLPRRNSDLFAFKANFIRSALEPGFLPVLSLPGAYGGMVVGDGGRTTLACCIRRDTLAACRALSPDDSAGAAVEAFLYRACAGVREVLRHAERDGAWLAVGPLCPGIRVDSSRGIFRVGNAAGESHPLIGEGISMALQSAALLAGTLGPHRACDIDGPQAQQLHQAYAVAWRRAFGRRLRLAALYAHLAMRPFMARPARTLLERWPNLLAGGARLAGKATRAAPFSSTTAEIA